MRLGILPHTLWPALPLHPQGTCVSNHHHLWRGVVCRSTDLAPSWWTRGWWGPQRVCGDRDLLCWSEFSDLKATRAPGSPLPHVCGLPSLPPFPAWKPQLLDNVSQTRNGRSCHIKIVRRLHLLAGGLLPLLLWGEEGRPGLGAVKQPVDTSPCSLLSTSQWKSWGDRAVEWGDISLGPAAPDSSHEMAHNRHFQVGNSRDDGARLACLMRAK